jgi:hypothetical protein
VEYCIYCARCSFDSLENAHVEGGKDNAQCLPLGFHDIVVVVFDFVVHMIKSDV